MSYEKLPYPATWRKRTSTPQTHTETPSNIKPREPRAGRGRRLLREELNLEEKTEVIRHDGILKPSASIRADQTGVKNEGWWWRGSPKERSTQLDRWRVERDQR